MILKCIDLLYTWFTSCTGYADNMFHVFFLIFTFKDKNFAEYLTNVAAILHSYDTSSFSNLRDRAVPLIVSIQRYSDPFMVVHWSIQGCSNLYRVDTAQPLQGGACIGRLLYRIYQPPHAHTVLHTLQNVQCGMCISSPIQPLVQFSPTHKQNIFGA